MLVLRLPTMFELGGIVALLALMFGAVFVVAGAPFVFTFIMVMFCLIIGCALMWAANH